MQKTPLIAVTAADEAWLHDCKPHPGRRMTEEEFVEWVDDTTRAEWVDGEVIRLEWLLAREPPDATEVFRELLGEA